MDIVLVLLEFDVFGLSLFSNIFRLSSAGLPTTQPCFDHMLVITASRGHINSGNSTEFGHYTGLGKGLARISICQALYSGQIQCYSHGICALCFQ